MKHLQTDVLIIGAGPAGCTAAAILSKNNVDCLVVEKTSFPRFVIGESLLPSCLDHLDEMGLLEKCRESGFQYKDGARFIRNGIISEFDFSEQYHDGHQHAWQVKRADFDILLSDHVQSLGVKILFNTYVLDVETGPSLQVSHVAGEGGPTEIKSKFVIDASGYGRVLPRLMDLNAPSTLRAKSAFFAHIRSLALWDWIDELKVNYIIGPDSSYVWIIPFADGSVSIGIVADDALFDHTDAADLLSRLYQYQPLDELLAQDCKIIRPAKIIRGFSIGVKKFYGDGYVLAGNTTEFLDPVFSSGVSIAMESASKAAALLIDHLNGQSVDWETDYESYMREGIAVFKSFVESWYSGELIRIFYHDKKPQSIKEQLCSVLAGYVWDRNNPFVYKHEKALKSISKVIS